MRYTNETCNGCGRRFNDDDDIVVCPVCGTPQHRECWQENNACVNLHLHEDGFEWKPKHSHEETKEEQKKPTITCPYCGYENPADAKQCENCSQPFELFGKSIFPPQSEKTNSSVEYSYKPPFEVDYKEPESGEDGFRPFPEGDMMPEGQVVKRVYITDAESFEPTVLGERTEDFAAYVRASIPSYYKKFKKAENGKVFTFNFAALIFGPLWFFFRKLFKQGIVFLALSLCVTMAFYAPLSQVIDSYSDIMNEVYELRESDTQPSEEQMEATIQRLYEFGEKNTPVMLTYFASMAAINIAAGFVADVFYRKKFLKDMESAREESEGINEKRQLLVLRKGGVSLFMPVVAYAAMQLITSILVQVFFE